MFVFCLQEQLQFPCINGTEKKAKSNSLAEKLNRNFYVSKFCLSTSFAYTIHFHSFPSASLFLSLLLSHFKSHPHPPPPLLMKDHSPHFHSALSSGTNLWSCANVADKNHFKKKESKQKQTLINTNTNTTASQ